MQHLTITAQDAAALLTRGEDHYVDYKAIEIKPASLEKWVSAFGNSSGGEIFVGVDEPEPGRFDWRGFARIEDANAHVHVLLEAYPESDSFKYETLTAPGYDGHVLRVSIGKTRGICKTAAGAIYVRGVASVKQLTTSEQMRILELQKGIASHEDETTKAPIDMVSDSLQVTEFVVEALTFTEPEPWLRSQMLIVEERPTVAAVLLFADEPQIVLPKASVMVYRYASTDAVGRREDLVDGKTWNVEGSAIRQIHDAVAKTTELIESVKGKNLQDVSYPPETLHEIITNAVIHRDYSIADNIHVRIFDDRVEVDSPGALPGNVTPQNLPGARFSRNETIERLLHKFPDAPNKNVGEGLTTAFEAMKAMRLAPPEVAETDGRVLVAIRHEPLDSPATIILRHLAENETISNREARGLTNIASDRKMCRIFEAMMEQGAIEQVPGTNKGGYRYRAATPGQQAN
ncbi:ATP-binding protein [Microbacterium arborescens]|uniref:ATP-binding protein n=1 Tax=Microbacterium arborescens TaxID=33883 RepID=UPI00278813CF|nr:ATP-binding protein [Microbacterium arborescens]MDQ1218119.1 ATP-dependent DNA helicase RecG [Microbacterium arborescens]